MAVGLGDNESKSDPRRRLDIPDTVVPTRCECGLSAGCRADIVLLDGDHPSLAARTGDALIDGWIFAASENPVRHVMVGGDWVIRDGCHRLETEIEERYREVVARLA